ncbi:uncharacterized protein BYT42DRAFT_613958 [Radiomyces spectabilis]|uniref:uncharacterized protein n=1 Tax=Radiomyces spectabilis TaxID=64574 RepID=UPI002220271D|nr:uncharacterized protein BYT42DRAFT_613958 [Radiomyces spectabilis]KAI8379675.1 hypothetical protein BYT42DRAFT_613958 [Radiomyces spectabilis]
MPAPPPFAPKFTMIRLKLTSNFLPSISPRPLGIVPKKVIKQSCRQHGRYEATRRQRLARNLKSQRNKMLRARKRFNEAPPQLTDICRQLAEVQSEIVYIQSLKANMRWREQGETSAGYIKQATH